MGVAANLTRMEVRTIQQIIKDELVYGKNLEQLKRMEAGYQYAAMLLPEDLFLTLELVEENLRIRKTYNNRPPAGLLIDPAEFAVQEQGRRQELDQIIVKLRNALGSY